MTIESFIKIKNSKFFKNKYLLSDEDKDFIAESRKQICSILFEKKPFESKLLIVAGPCSIHDENSALEYAEKILEMQKKIGDHFLLVMRFYFEKPRTRTGWKGLLYDPQLDGSCDLETGIDVTRRLMYEITRMRVPLASEMVDPICLHYFNDLISWLCIGARTSSSQAHRQMVSGQTVPVGFKNDLSGSIGNAVNSLIASSNGHTYLAIDDEGEVGVCKSRGANHSHIVLRGAQGQPNYQAEMIKEFMNELDKQGLTRCIMIDCSHENCGKKHENISTVFRNVVEQVENGNDWIRGLMIESHLLPGSQLLSDGTLPDPKISITDPCIGWAETEELIHWADKLLFAQLIRKRKK